ncbi:MAG TPA: 4Fe-4S dicluster domain-containing protein, partial [Polyangiaceae bacterium]|nr:4Fe-4S dicluster domain-containing protein [Polyangiaceae bacterium]
GYDRRRGEPRGRDTGGSLEPRGDCVDCGACVAACPTGIDIRDGLQLECVACAQCIDACDSVMHKFGRAPGLIRYASQRELAAPSGSGAPPRGRLLAYGVLLAGLLGALALSARGRREPEVTLLRGIGAPFEMRGDHVENQIRIKIQNRSDQMASYQLSISGVPEAELIAPENPFSIPADGRATTSVFVLLPASALPHGSRDVQFGISDGKGLELHVPYRLLGPEPRALAPRALAEERKGS